jgi:hypothetical protein
VNAQTAPVLPALKVAMQTCPCGYEIIVWTNKYRALKQYAAVP